MVLLIILSIVLVISLLAHLYLFKRKKKFDGYMVITTKESGGKLFSLEIDKEPEEFESMTYVVFKVVIDPIDVPD